MEPSPELEDLTRRIAEAVGTGDAAFLAQVVSRRAPVAFLGTGPDDWWAEVDALIQALAAQHGAGVGVIPGNPVAYVEGNVGWAVDRSARFRFADQEFPFRFSVVYHREEGEWRMVHFHSSLPVSDQEALGTELSNP